MRNVLELAQLVSNRKKLKEDDSLKGHKAQRKFRFKFAKKITFRSSSSSSCQQCDLIGQNFATLANFKTSLAISLGVFKLNKKGQTTMAIIQAIGQILVVENGLILARYCAIWSHWSCDKIFFLSFFLVGTKFAFALCQNL